MTQPVENRFLIPTIEGQLSEAKMEEWQEDLQRLQNVADGEKIKMVFQLREKWIDSNGNTRLRWGPNFDEDQP